MTAPTGDARQPAPGLSALVVFRGAATGLLLAMPAAFASSVLSAQTPKPRAAINISFLIVMIGFGLAGWLAGREAPSQVAKHGALAALVAFIPVEVVAVLGRLDRGAPVGIGAIVIIGLFAACMGTIGSRIGARKRNWEELG